MAYALPMLRLRYDIATLSEHYSNDSPTLLERTAEIIDGIIIEGDSQFLFDGHALLVETEIPDAFTQNGIHYRSDFILRAPYGIKVNHNTRYSILR